MVIIYNNYLSQGFIKDIFFSIVDDNISEKFNLETFVKKPYKTDSIILKLEKEFDMNEISFKNHLSIKIYKSYYDMIYCLENEKSNILINNNFVYIPSEKNETNCYKRFDFFNTTREFKNSYYNNQKNNKEIDYLYLQQYLDINLPEINNNIIDYVSNLFNWDDDTFYELVFIVKENKLMLHKIFIYYTSIKNVNYISLIKEGKSFQNIFLFYKSAKRLLKYTKNYKQNNKERITMRDFNIFTHNNVIKIDHHNNIFHNLINIDLDENIFSKNNDDLTCLHVYQHLTEDLYVEKNELRNYLNNKYKKVDIYGSSYIDQELSSDLTEQYYISFRICDIQGNLNKISYPYHYRYQPPSSIFDYQDVFLPIPIIRFDNRELMVMNHEIMNKNIINKEDYYVRRNKNKDIPEIFNDRKLFLDEIYLKSELLDYYKQSILNLDNNIQKIPIAKSQHFWIVAFITALITFVGFIMILYQIVIYSIKYKDKIE